jgi:phosphotransferase system enzyme I (PtsI)
MEYRGIAAAPGYALGKVSLLQQREIAVTKRSLSPWEIPAEMTRLETEAAQAIGEIAAIREVARQKLGDEAAEIFTAQILALQDPEYIGGIAEKIRQEAINAEAAVQVVTEQFLALFAEIDNEYIRERGADLRDVSQRLLRRLLGVPKELPADKTENVILVAHDLAPSDTVQLDRDTVAGIATDVGGRTSHSAIMARSMGIPAVVGLECVVAAVKPGDFAVVDGEAGLVLINPPDDLIRHYRAKKEQADARRQIHQKLIGVPSITRDGCRVELTANIGSVEDAEVALANGAEGVGLFRTEFLYMGRNQLPNEEEQFVVYKKVALLFGRERPVIIRSLDIGGDKGLPYLAMAPELNPFLGHRAIRLCLDRTALFKTQLRAILRASAYGNIKLMYPMIATLEELRDANRILEEGKQELRRENIAFNPAMEVGIMVEIPAVAVMADQFALEVDFFSIGTNDLIQYTMAADRTNEKVAYLYQPFNPAVLRLIQGVITAGHRAGKWVGMCGEMAGEAAAVPLLLGMGLDEFSMSAGAILQARAMIRRLNRKEAGCIATAVLEMASAAEIKQYVEQEVCLNIES